jgi:hypothetical protein
MFRASNAHLQGDTVVHMQHMILSLCKQVSGRVLLKHDLLDITATAILQQIIRPTTQILKSDYEKSGIYKITC